MKNLVPFNEFLIQQEIDFLTESFLGNPDAILDFDDEDIKRVQEFISSNKLSNRRIVNIVESIINSIDSEDEIIMANESVDYVLSESGEEISDTIRQLFKNKKESMGVTEKAVTTDSVDEISRFHPGKHPHSNGTLFLPTWSAFELYESVIKPEFDDGIWANVKKEYNPRFWLRLNYNSKLGSPKIIMEPGKTPPSKVSYSFTPLLREYKQKMINIGQFARAMGRMLDRHQSKMAAYMPETYEEFVENKSSGNWKYPFVKVFADKVSVKDADKYYKTTYGEMSLKEDLAAIRKAMKSI